MSSISIALATHNGCKYIVEQLESLQEQVLLPVEVVVCDDVSTDNTLELVDDFAARAPFPVKVFCNETRLGYRDNFMKAASLCRGDLIAFCDQDDVWSPRKLLEVEKRFNDAGVMLVCHNADIVDTQGNVLGKVHVSDAEEDLVYEPLGISPWHFPLGFTMTFRRDLLAFSELRRLSSDYFDGTEKLAHDQWIFLLGVVFGRVVRIPETLARYRQHEANAFGLERPHKTFGFRLKEKFTKFVNFDSYQKSCADVIKVLEKSSLLPLSDELHLKKDVSIDFFRNLEGMYRNRYIAYSSKNFFSRMRSWVWLRASGGYDQSRACHFERKEASRDLLLGVVMAGLCKKRRQGPAMDWSLIVNAGS